MGIICLSNRYIHLYWTGPPILASYGKCRGRCSITLKKYGGKIISILHNILEIFLSMQSASFICKLDAHRSLKNWLNLVRTFQTFVGSNSLTAIGNNLSIKMWQSWSFKLCKFAFLPSTHRLKLLAQPLGSLSYFSHSHKVLASSLLITYAALGTVSLRFPSSCSVV